MHNWIDSPAALATWLDEARVNSESTPACIALDTEFMRTNTLAPRLALVQVCIGDRVGLIDVVALPQPEALTRLLRSAGSVCVMHSAGEDLEALAPMLPDGPAELFDTQIAAAMAGVGFGMSYQKLVAQLLGVEIAKAETRSDWLQRPLSAAQLDYAAQDVLWLPQIHGQLAKKLEELGRSDWLRQDCRALIDRVCHAQPDLQPQRALRGAADWPVERQALLRRLLLWRDAAARQLDKPRPWLLDDAHALGLASKPPRDGDDLFERTRGLRALRGPQRQQLLEVLQAPLTSEDMAIAPIPSNLDSAQKRTVAELKAIVTGIAEQLAIADGLLCPRRHLETLVTERTWPAALEGWRKPLLHDALMAKL